MRKFKRITCLVLCMAVMISGVYAVAAKDSFVPDPQGQSLVSALGFYNDFSDNYVTRRAYINALLRADGHIATDAVFTDEALSESAREAKLIGVYDDGKAGLDTLITYGEVLAGVVYTLGYDITMESGEKSLSGMITTANRLGIGKGIDKTAKANITGAEFGEILYRMLLTDAVEVKGYTSDGMIADITRDRTMLEIYHNIYSHTGRVTANSRSDLYNPGGLGEGKIRIDEDMVMNVGNTDADFYLGYEVDCYYKVTNNEKTLVWIEKDERCEELYLEAHEIDGYDYREYRYFENDKMRKAALSPDVSVIYNSVATSFSRLTPAQIVPSVGEVSLIDCDGRGGYDTVIIMNYQSAISGGAIETSLVDSKGSVILDAAELEDYDVYDKNYTSVQLEAVLSGGVLWVAKSLDGSYASVIISSDSVTGSVTGQTVSDGYTILQIDGKKYRVSKGCVDAEAISVGLSAEFYLDPAGNIAGCRAVANPNLTFGYLYNAKETGTFGTSVDMRIFDGEHKGIECADKVRVNGESAKTPEEILAPVTAEDGSIVPQLIRFRLNDDGKLAEYETAITLEDGSDESDRLFIEAQTPASDAGLPGVYYQSGYHYTVGNLIAFETTSKIFIIPADLSREKDFQLTTPQYIADGYLYGLTAYKTDSSYDWVTAAVWRDTAATLDKSIVANDTPYVVLDIVETLYDDEEAFSLTVASGATVSEVSVTDEVLLGMIKSSKLKKGDMIRFDLSANGQMASYMKDYDYETHTIVNTEAAGGFTAKYRLIAGEVTRKMNSSVKVKPTVPFANPYVQEEQIIFGAYGLTRSATVNILRDNISVRSASIADVNVGDKFVYMSRNGFVLFMYIIKD